VRSRYAKPPQQQNKIDYGSLAIWASARGRNPSPAVAVAASFRTVRHPTIAGMVAA
jgi:Putative FMN-binding domain